MIQNYKDSKKFIWRILDIGCITKNAVYNYNVEKKKYEIFQSTSTDEPHIVFYDPNLSVGSFIALSVYATYRGSFLIPFNRSIIEKKSIMSLSRNLNNKIRSQNGIIKETDIYIFKRNIKEYGDLISGLIEEKWQEFLFRCIGRSNFQEEKKLKLRVGLGYVTLFINRQDFFYEGLRIENQQFGALFNIGRIPSDNSMNCMKIVNNSFQRWLSPRPSWFTFSLISLFENPSYSEILRDITADLFSVFNTIEAKKAKVKIPTKQNISEILTLVEKSSNLLIWSHGNTDYIKIQDGKEIVDIFDLERLSDMNFNNPELAILNSCRTGGVSKYAGRTLNVANILMNRGFNGILAPFWFVDVGTASDFTLNFLTNIIFGVSASTIVRRGKLFDSSNFPETYVYYGDPTYMSESFYPHECTKISKHYHKMMKKKYLSANGKQFAHID